MEETFLPEPGTFIPVDQHFYLDNSFCDFREKECVALEVYDPDLGDAAGDTGETDPLYIYATVVRKEKAEENVPIILQRYSIDLGPDKGTAVVPVTKLYRLIEPDLPRDATVSKTVADGRTVAQGSFVERKDNQIYKDHRPLKAVLREIRQDLIQAWKLPDKSEQVRVIQRLYHTWHPEKNRGREDLCKQVLQKLQYYENLHKQGKTIDFDDDDDDDVVDGRSVAQGSFVERKDNQIYKDKIWVASHFETVQHRIQRQDILRSEYACGQIGSTRRPNPQPSEGRRWLRQAEADFFVAQREASKKYTEGHNWICFQSHQAAEKVLKAFLYHQDANCNSLRTHELVKLAQDVGDKQLVELADQLEQCTGNNMRMRYPDVLVFPQIPADAAVYNMDHAMRAIDIAGQTIKRTKELLRQYFPSVQ